MHELGRSSRSLGCLIVYYGYRITITTRCIVRSLQQVQNHYRIRVRDHIIVDDMISHGMGVKGGSP